MWSLFWNFFIIDFFSIFSKISFPMNVCCRIDVVEWIATQNSFAHKQNGQRTGNDFGHFYLLKRERFSNWKRNFFQLLFVCFFEIVYFQLLFFRLVCFIFKFFKPNTTFHLNLFQIWFWFQTKLTAFRRKKHRLNRHHVANHRKNHRQKDVNRRKNVWLDAKQRHRVTNKINSITNIVCRDCFHLVSV